MLRSELRLRLRFENAPKNINEIMHIVDKNKIFLLLILLPVASSNKQVMS